MSDKRKISTILGICGATVLAAGGSIFLTNTGLSLLDQSQQIEGETDPGLGVQTKETEQPITVEQFSKTKDSFVVSSKKASDSKTGTDDQKTSGTENGSGTGASGQDENMMYATGGVNVRSSAGVEGDILGTLQVGEGVTVTGNREGNWVEVSYNGQTGYVSQNYLQTGSSSGGSGSANSSSSGGSSTTNSGSSSGTGTANGSSSNGSSGSSSNGSGSTGSSQTGNSSGNSSNTSSTPAVIAWNVTSMSGTMYATGDVNVRSGAGTSNDRIGGLSAGSSVTVTGSTDNGWIQVSYDGQTGYVAGNYLSWDKPSSGGSSNGSGGSSGAWDSSYTYDLSSRYVSADEFDGWSASELAVVRNEIFARHGRIFTTQKYKDYFAQKTWYEPTYDPSYFDANLDSFLNDYEWANLAVVQKLEDARS